MQKGGGNDEVPEESQPQGGGDVLPTPRHALPAQVEDHLGHGPRAEVRTFDDEVLLVFREPEAKWVKCQGRSPSPSPRQKVVVQKNNSLVKTLKGMCNVFPKSRLPKYASLPDPFEQEVMEGVIR